VYVYERPINEYFILLFVDDQFHSTAISECREHLEILSKNYYTRIFSYKP